MDVIFVGLKNNTFYKSLIISIIRFTYSLNSYKTAKRTKNYTNERTQKRKHLNSNEQRSMSYQYDTQKLRTKK